jgi:hypothetical protein
MKKAGDLVEGFFETFGIRDDKNYAGFIAAWTDIIGERLATHSRPSDIKGQVLIVAVDHPGWMTHIRMAEREVIKKIQKRFPQLAIISVAFQLVDKLPPPSRGKKAIDQAERDGGASEKPSADQPDNIDPSDAKEIVHEEAVTDKAVLFSALDRLRVAMEKKKTQEGQSHDAD